MLFTLKEDSGSCQLVISFTKIYEHSLCFLRCNINVSFKGRSNFWLVYWTNLNINSLSTLFIIISLIPFSTTVMQKYYTKHISNIYLGNLGICTQIIHLILNWANLNFVSLWWYQIKFIYIVDVSTTWVWAVSICIYMQIFSICIQKNLYFCYLYI